MHSAYLLEDDGKALTKAVPVFTMMVLCETGFAVMISAAMLLFLLIYRLLYHRKGKCLPVIGAMLVAFLITGIWLYASMKGRGNTGSSGVMRGMFQDAWISLNPIRRLTRGNVDFYFGLSSFMVAVFGALCSKRKSMAGFWTALFLFAGTTTSVYAVLDKLSAGHPLWMLSFISVAAGMILYSFMKWNSLKRGFVVICCVLLVADCIPSFSLIYQGKGTVSADERLHRTADACLITKAREVTSQRAAILDGGSLGAVAPYLLTGYDKKQVKGTFGTGNISAATAVNIAELEEAAEKGYYLYLFDRALELGNDLSRAIGSEFAMLASPQTLPLFVKKYQQRRLKQYRRREPIHKGMGDIICCLDESGSTRGDADAWGKAVALTLLDIAEEKRRKFALIHFAGSSECKVDVFLPGQYSMQDKMNAAESFLNGGTDFERPLGEAIQLMDAGFENADIVFLTDGLCELPEDYLAKLHKEQAARKFTVTGILLDAGNPGMDFSLTPFCQKIYRTSELTGDEIVSGLVSRRV